MKQSKKKNQVNQIKQIKNDIQQSETYIVLDDDKAILVDEGKVVGIAQNRCIIIDEKYNDGSKRRSANIAFLLKYNKMIDVMLAVKNNNIKLYEMIKENKQTKAQNSKK